MTALSGTLDATDPHFQQCYAIYNSLATQEGWTKQWFISGIEHHDPIMKALAFELRNTFLSYVVRHAPDFWLEMTNNASGLRLYWPVDLKTGAQHNGDERSFTVSYTGYLVQRLYRNAVYLLQLDQPDKPYGFAFHRNIVPTKVAVPYQMNVLGKTYEDKVAQCEYLRKSVNEVIYNTERTDLIPKPHYQAEAGEGDAYTWINTDAGYNVWTWPELFHQEVVWHNVKQREAF